MWECAKVGRWEGVKAEPSGLLGQFLPHDFNVVLIEADGLAGAEVEDRPAVGVRMKLTDAITMILPVAIQNKVPASRQ